MSGAPTVNAAFRRVSRLIHGVSIGETDGVTAREMAQEEFDKLAELEKLVKLSINALRCANNGFMGSPYGQKVVDDALIALEKGGSK